MIDGRYTAARSCTTATGAAKTSRSNTPNAWPKPAWSLRSAVSEIPMTTPSPKPSQRLPLPLKLSHPGFNIPVAPRKGRRRRPIFQQHRSASGIGRKGGIWLPAMLTERSKDL